ncbi:MAG: type I restriction enzyme HsdR N-terminal domain-containing protein [Dysgonamonadaceae bacterium]
MLNLNLPPCEIKIKKTEKGLRIFDSLRAKFVALTPEEWVRQNFVCYLINHKQYPPMLIANEMQIKVNSRIKRCDSVVYDNRMNPLVILEYKAPDVSITEQVFDQIVRYNYVLKVPYLIVSNGLRHYCCQVDYENQTTTYLQDIPVYGELV